MAVDSEIKKLESRTQQLVEDWFAFFREQQSQSLAVAAAAQQLCDELERLKQQLKDSPAKKRLTGPLMTWNEVAQICRVSPPTIKRWVAEGRLKSFSIDARKGRKKMLVEESELQRFLETAGL